jgi:hypothetical protein
LNIVHKWFATLPPILSKPALGSQALRISMNVYHFRSL